MNCYLDNKNYATEKMNENYKGIYADVVKDKKYICPVTGAHFEFKDMYRRIQKLLMLTPMIEELDLTQSSVKEQTISDKPLTKLN